MVLLTLYVLALFFIQTQLPFLIHYLGVPGERLSRFKLALGPRDAPPPRPLLAERADRALRNMLEALPIFVTLALLAIILRVDDDGTALTGASVFLIARIIYVPVYLMGVPLLRTLVWLASLVGLAMMVAALCSAL